MTIALGINFGNYVLMAADTRVTYQWGKFKVGFKDDNIKIRKTTIGIITGAGWIDLLESVKDRMEKQEITNSDQVFEIVKEERESLTKLSKFLQMDNFRTGWLFSYMTLIDGEPKVRLDIIHPSLAEGAVRCEENRLAGIFPIEYTHEKVDSVTEAINELIKPSSEFTSINESFNYHKAMIQELIKLIQPDCPSISLSFQVGVHTLSDQKEISEIIKIE